MKRPFLLLAVFAAAVLSAPAQPDALATARKAYSTAVEKATAPLRVDYLRTLEKMLDDHTRAGRLEQALAVKKEIVGTWLEGEWILNGGNTVTFRRDGTSTEGPWTIEGETVVISVGADWKVKAEMPKTFSPTVKKLVGQAFFRGKGDHPAVYVARN